MSLLFLRASRRLNCYCRFILKIKCGTSSLHSFSFNSEVGVNVKKRQVCSSFCFNVHVNHYHLTLKHQSHFQNPILYQSEGQVQKRARTGRSLITKSKSNEILILQVCLFVFTLILYLYLLILLLIIIANNNN